MTIDRIRWVYSNTYFCQIGKWGHSLSEAEAKLLGLLPVTKTDGNSSSKSKTIKPKNNNKKK